MSLIPFFLSHSISNPSTNSVSSPFKICPKSEQLSSIKWISSQVLSWKQQKLTPANFCRQISWKESRWLTAQTIRDENHAQKIVRNQQRLSMRNHNPRSSLLTNCHSWTQNAPPSPAWILGCPHSFVLWCLTPRGAYLIGWAYLMFLIPNCQGMERQGVWAFWLSQK